MVAGSRVFGIVLFSLVSPFSAPASDSFPVDPQSEYVGRGACESCQQDMPSTGSVEHFEFSRHFVSTHPEQRCAAGDSVLNSHWRAEYQGGTQECRMESTELLKKHRAICCDARHSIGRARANRLGAFMVVSAQFCEGS
jgi:hypothetical protein